MDTPAAGDEFRVLVIDDNHDAAKTMALLLRAWGFSSQYVLDSREALAVAEEYRPHCIISDLAMPKMDGYELARVFRAHNLFEKIPLIAHSATPDERRALDAGFNYSLVKPQSALVIGDLLRELQVMNKKLKEAEELTRQGAEVVTEVRDLMKEVREDVKEIKSELREVKEEVKELREERGGAAATDATGT